LKSYVTDDLGIAEGSTAYNAIRNTATSVEALGANGVNLIKGTWQLGETIGKPIGNALSLGIQYTQMKTGGISQNDFDGWYGSWSPIATADNNNLFSTPGNIINGLGKSTLGLVNNGYNFFNPNASLGQKTQSVGDFYNVAFAIEGIKSIGQAAKPFVQNAANGFINSTRPQFAMAGGVGIPFTEGINAMNNMGKMPIRNIVNASVKNGIGLSANSVKNAAKPFDIVRYGDKTSGIENHHGVLDVWAKNNIPGYIERASGSTSIALTGGKVGQHAATKAVYRDWLFEKTGKKVGGQVDWTKVTPQEIQSLSEKMMNAAGVPEAARRSYYQEFHRYIYSR
jgi:hypothetical protein